MKRQKAIKDAFIEKAAMEYRKKAAADHVEEVTEEKWAAIMQARMRAIYGELAGENMDMAPGRKQACKK